MKHLPFELRMEIYDLIDPKNCIFAELKNKSGVIVVVIPNRRFTKKLMLESKTVWLLTLKNYLCNGPVSISLLQDLIIKSNTFRESFVEPFFTRLRKVKKRL